MERPISPKEKVFIGDSKGFGNGGREVSPVDGDESASDSLADALFSDSDRTPSEVSSEHDDGMSNMEEPDGKDAQAEEEMVVNKDDDGDDQENVEGRNRVREIPRPVTMTSDQLKKHGLQCHTNYDPGCEDCVRARGLADPHKRKG